MAGTSSEVVIGGLKPSKKWNKNSRNHQLNQLSSANEVESIELLLVEIFLRVPVLSLIMFKSVSKRWYSLIASRDFIQRRNQVPNINPPSDLIIQRRTNSITYDLAALGARIQKRRILSKDSFPFGSYPDKRDIKILQSCNGLLLCYINRYMLYVYNPFTNHFKMLPPSRYLKPIACLSSIKMVFDPTKSPHYKVIFVEGIQDGGIIEDDDMIGAAFVQIRTYSSKTCDWSAAREQWSPLRYYNGFRDGVYWNDAIYWLNKKAGLLLKLDVVSLNLTSVPTPGDLRVGTLHFTHELFESRGSLLLSCVCGEPGVFLMVFEMKNGYSEWSLKLFIKVYDVILLIREDWELDESAKQIRIRCIVLEEKEEDSFMVMELYGKVVQYKMVSKTLHELSDAGAIPHCISMEPPRFSCFPFVASFAGV